MVPLELMTLSEFPDESGEHGKLQAAIDELEGVVGDLSQVVFPSCCPP